MECSPRLTRLHVEVDRLHPFRLILEVRRLRQLCNRHERGVKETDTIVIPLVAVHASVSCSLSRWRMTASVPLMALSASTVQPSPLTHVFIGAHAMFGLLEPENTSDAMPFVSTQLIMLKPDGVGTRKVAKRP